MRKQYTAEFKAQVVREVLREEKTIGQVASEYGVHPSQVIQWRDKVLAGLPELLSRKGEEKRAATGAAHEKEVHELYAEIGKLTTQLTWLKKKLATSTSRSERMRVVEWENREMSISLQAELLGLNRTSLYYQPVGVLPETVALRRRIDEVYTAHPYYGVRRITVHLRREGLVVNHKAIAHHMREMGLAGICPGPNLSKRNLAHAVYPYLLRDITAGQPDHVWGIDITYIRLQGGWMYLVAVLDWFSRYVVSWALDLTPYRGITGSGCASVRGLTLEIGFVLDAVRRALAQAAPVIWNSDQGSHFTSPQYTNLLTEAKVQISMDGRGRALDNIFTERLWRTVKYEEVYLHDYANPRDARSGLTRYLSFYNEERPHQALNYRTPAEVYFQKGAVSILNQSLRPS